MWSLDKVGCIAKSSQQSVCHLWQNIHYHLTTNLQNHNTTNIFDVVRIITSKQQIFSVRSSPDPPILKKIAVRSSPDPVSSEISDLTWCTHAQCNVVTSVLWCHEFQTRMKCYVTIYGHGTPSVKHVSFRVTRQFCIWSQTVMYVYCFLLT